MFLTRAPRAEGFSDRSVYGGFWFESIGMRSLSGARVSAATAMQLPAVWACVSVLAKSFALMPFDLFEEQEGKGRKKRREHWLYRLIAKRPNEFQTPFEWRMMLMGHLALRGNAFCQIAANARGEITDLLPLHPDRMQAEMLPNGNCRYVYTDENGKQIRYLRSEIWHLRWMSNDGIVGMNPMEVAREAIGEGLAMQSYASRFFANDARPGGWIEYDGRFANKEARQTFKDSWQENYSGRNARKVAVLEKGMKYHELTIADADTQFVTARGRNVSDIARIFGVPPHKIGDLSRSTNNNIEHQSIEFWTDTMLPWAEMWESSIEFFLLGPDTVPELEPEFDMSRMMRGDGKARAERIKGLVLAGVLKPNEGRAEEGYDPVEGGDKLLRPVNMVAIDENGDPEEPPGAPDDGMPPAPPGSGGDPNARMMALVRGNAGRMARRLAGGSAPSPDVLAESLAIEPAAAAEWLQHTRAVVSMQPMTEQEFTESLVSLALGNKPNPMAVGAAAMRQLSTSISAMPAPVVHSSVNVEPATVNVTTPDVHAHFELPASNVTVEAPVVHNHNAVNVPETQVRVDVAAPSVTVENIVPAVEVPKPVVHNHVQVAPTPVHVMPPKQAGQADRPWPTETVIKKRDAAGRADVIETRPLDN